MVSIDLWLLNTRCLFRFGIVPVLRISLTIPARHCLCLFEYTLGLTFVLWLLG